MKAIFLAFSPSQLIDHIMSYLIENLECEHSYLRRLWGFWRSLETILAALDFNPHCCWALIETDMRDLGVSLKGDVDILIGRTTFSDPKQFDAALNEEIEARKTAHSNALIQFMNPYITAADNVAWGGGLRWPPATDYLVGVEVKCSRLSLDADPYRGDLDESDMKSTKSSRRKTDRIRLEVDKLLNLGLNKVALLDLIANPPADGVNLNAWINASVIAEKTERAMERVINDRLPPDSTAGHWVYSLGAVAGDDELMRGAGYPNQYRTPQENKVIGGSEVGDRRQVVEQNIGSIFSKMPNPNHLPALFINCRACRVIHLCAMGIPCCQ